MNPVFRTPGKNLERMGSPETGTRDQTLPFYYGLPLRWYRGRLTVLFQNPIDTGKK